MTGERQRPRRVGESTRNLLPRRNPLQASCKTATSLPTLGGMAKLACADSFVPAWFDYGAFHKPVIGFGIHMAEGGGTVGYLDKSGNPPPRGVSVHFVIEYSGAIVQMLDVTHACGGMNPDDRSTNKAYYGHDILVAVLGANWFDPNGVSIQIEIEGFAKDGPNAKQVASVIKLVAELRKVIPTLRGAFGHADQTDTKGCPGTTVAMRNLFDAIGGHGLWKDDNDVVPLAINDRTPKLVDVPAGKRYDLDGVHIFNADGLALSNRYSPYGTVNGFRAVYGTVLGLPRLILVKPSNIHDIAPPVAVPDPAQLDAAYNSGVTAAVTAAATARK